MKTRTISLRTRLAAAFGAIALVLAGVAAIALVQLDSLDQAQSRLAQLQKMLQQVSDWQGLTRLNVARTLDLARAGSPPALARALDGEMKQTSAKISEMQKGIESSLDFPDAKARLDAIAAARKSYIAMRTDLLKALGDKKQAQAAAGAVDARLLPAANTYLGTLEALQGAVEQQRQKLDDVRVATSRHASVVLITAGAAGLVLAMLFAWLAGRAAAQLLGDLTASAKRIARGDLTKDVRVTRTDEIGQLQQALAEMQESLRGIVDGIRTGTQCVGAASTQIASGNQDLSMRTERAAGSLQETASTMDRLSRAIAESSRSAVSASSLADEAVDVAQRGRDVVSQVVGTMTGIDTSSSRIAEITSVIDTIAFQTNILALNAAVEAARAGEQGRGFAVVAGEVRALAGRSAQAAREIKSLVDASTQQVGAGKRLVQDAGIAMQDIESTVRRFSEAFHGIRDAAAGQAEGIGEVAQAVAHLDEMTQQNAALVEQSAAAAESLSQQAQQLTRSVSSFRLEADYA